MTDITERLRDFALSDDGAIDPTPLAREAADEIERLETDCDRLREFNTRLCTGIERLEAALESLTRDPPATLDEPDTDAEVIMKMRAIAGAALDIHKGGEP